ncbi:reverse transcriptase domain-containing protein [Tanacetum coccineum]|uniref:Reverse transcriptase domain-containing protein n=1 Tax=Tanacetum coccineum TaxID=301880 RepID=A0ABQ5EFD1_9ASTR
MGPTCHVSSMWQLRVTTWHPRGADVAISKLALASFEPGTSRHTSQILSRPENAGRMAKWHFQLAAYDINYRPRTSIRGQVLEYFIAERPEEDSPPAETPAEKDLPEPWILFTDGSSCLEGSIAGLILTNPEGMEFTYALRFEFDASNNEAEYEALMAGLRITEQMGVKNLEAIVDSGLVANQINGSYIAKEQSMIQYLEKAKTLISGFKKFSIEQLRSLNQISLGGSFKRNSIEEKEILYVVEEEGYSWMTPLLEYLTDDTLPAEAKKARAIKIKSRQHVVIGGVMYRKSFLEPWLRCVGPLQAEYVVREIHEGSYSMHSGPREIISDNGKQFMDNPFKDWCDKLNIKQRCASVKHPQTNVQVERANHSLGEGVKARKSGKKAAIQEAKSKAKMEKYYNAKVRSTTFKLGDFVYCRNEASHAKDSGKLGPKWEGPYEVVEALGKGAYKIRNRSEDVLPRTWNVRDLKKCYL